MRALPSLTQFNQPIDLCFLSVSLALNYIGSNLVKILKFAEKFEQSRSPDKTECSPLRFPQLRDSTSTNHITSHPLPFSRHTRGHAGPSRSILGDGVFGRKVKLRLNDRRYDQGWVSGGGSISVGLRMQGWHVRLDHNGATVVSKTRVLRIMNKISSNALHGWPQWRRTIVKPQEGVGRARGMVWNGLAIRPSLLRKLPTHWRPPHSHSWKNGY
jgi:hypothetical protein